VIENQMGNSFQKGSQPSTCIQRTQQAIYKISLVGFSGIRDKTQLSIESLLRL